MDESENCMRLTMVALTLPWWGIGLIVIGAFVVGLVLAVVGITAAMGPRF